MSARTTYSVTADLQPAESESEVGHIANTKKAAGRMTLGRVDLQVCDPTSRSDQASDSSPNSYSGTWTSRAGLETCPTNTGDNVRQLGLIADAKKAGGRMTPGRVDLQVCDPTSRSDQASDSSPTSGSGTWTSRAGLETCPTNTGDNVRQLGNIANTTKAAGRITLGRVDLQVCDPTSRSDQASDSSPNSYCGMWAA